MIANDYNPLLLNKWVINKDKRRMYMQTVVFGKIIEKRHEIDAKVKTIEEDGNKKIVYTAKPEKKVTEEIVGYKEILRFDGEPRYNSNVYDFFNFSTEDKFNIAENEVVKKEEEIFRADLNEVHLRTNKVLETRELYKDEIENVHQTYVEDFNEQMIISNERMKSYCDLHKLVYGETDAIELFKLVYPDDVYEIKDGKMIVKEKDLSEYAGRLIIDGYGNYPVASIDWNGSTIGKAISTK